MDGMICPRCKEVTGHLFRISVETTPIGALCYDCLKDLKTFLEALPTDGEQHWDRLGAMDGSEMVERFDIKDGFV